MRSHSLIDRRWILVTRCVYLLAALGVTATPALAHSNTGLGVGFASGFTHPLSGMDHILTMVAVGIWGTQLGRPATWLLPVTFPLVMSMGGVLGVRGVPIPGVEIGVAASAMVMGLMILLAARPSLRVAAVIVGVFAIFHGHAHGTELPKAAYPLAYGVGFVLSTGLLHITGVAIGLIDRWPVGARALRGLGAAIGATGLYLLVALGQYDSDQNLSCRARSFPGPALANNGSCPPHEGSRRFLRRNAAPDLND